MQVINKYSVLGIGMVCIVPHGCMGLYHIALIFRGSKFSRIATLKKFVEKISRIRVAHVCYSAVSQILVE